MCWNKVSFSFIESNRISQKLLKIFLFLPSRWSSQTAGCCTNIHQGSDSYTMIIWKQVIFKQIELSMCVELIWDLFMCLNHEKALVLMVCWLFKYFHRVVKVFKTEIKINLNFEDTYYLTHAHCFYLFFITKFKF